MTEAVTFDALTAGSCLGSCAMAVTACDVAAFDGLLPRPAVPGSVPPGFAVALMMRGYMSILPRRPPGNIHASLQLEWGVPLTIGDRVRLSLRCAGKEWRRGRPWVRFESMLERADGALVLAGTKWMVWAA